MAGSIPYINDGNFESLVLGASTGTVLLDFTATWCGPCQTIAKHLDVIAGERGAAVSIYKLDIDANPQTPARYGVMSIPTLLLFKNGKLVNKQVGAVNKAKLDDFINSAG
jgi:thioredoxin 1